MPVYVGFLRAVNVGKRQVRMERLRQVLTDHGFRDVQTYIQSGNVKVTTSRRSAAKVEEELHEVISDAFGFDVPVVVRTPAQLRRIADDVERLESPIADDARRYVTFMSGPCSADGIAVLHSWDVPTEAARVVDDHVVLFLSGGVQDSKLTNARIEKLTGAVGTARSLTVVRALAGRWGTD